MLTKTDLPSTYHMNRAQKLGQGTFGSVYEGTHKTSLERVAIKEIENFDIDVFDTKYLLREISTLRMLKGHRHIIALKDIFVLDHTVTLVFERCDTDLHRIIA